MQLLVVRLIKSYPIKKMVRLITESTKLKMEIGAALCEVNSKIELGRKTVGETVSVKMKEIPKCKVGKQIGTFHTHPGGPSVLTPMDQRVFLRRVGRSESRLMCVGSPFWVKGLRKNVITCAEPTKDKRAVNVKIVYIDK